MSSSRVHTLRFNSAMTSSAFDKSSMRQKILMVSHKHQLTQQLSRSTSPMQPERTLTRITFWRGPWHKFCHLQSVRSSPTNTNDTIKPTNAAEGSFRASRPIGIFIDTSAPRSVARKQELLHLSHHLGNREKKPKPSMYPFPFGNKVFESLGVTVLPLATFRHVDTTLVEMGVVNTNLQATIALDAVDENSLTPCIVTSMLDRCVLKQGKPMNL